MQSTSRFSLSIRKLLQGLGGKRLIQFNHIQVLVRRVLLAIRDASEAPSSKPLARSGLDDSTIS
jgi:hypothetical protein